MKKYVILAYIAIVITFGMSCKTTRKFQDEKKYPYFIEADNRYERGTEEWKNIAINGI